MTTTSSKTSLIAHPAVTYTSAEATGTLKFTPVADESGTATITVTVEDGGLDGDLDTGGDNGTTIRTFEVTVNPVNDAPLATTDSYSTYKGEQLIVVTAGVLTNDSDVDGDSLTAVLVADVAAGTLSLVSDGGFTYTPATGFEGIDSFTYKANDGSAESNTVTVTIDVIPIDFGDAPNPYPVMQQENGALHQARGPRLGSSRDSELDGTHSAAADADGSDEDGVTFGTIQVGQLDSTATVNVQNASEGARLDVWIDFNADGNWGGPSENIASSVAVVNGDNSIEFDIPAWALSGTTYARFRLSTSGDLGIGGAATDGEVEDYQIEIDSPLSASGIFGAQQTIGSASGAISVFAIDMDGDGDMDVLSASDNDDKIGWYENNGNQTFTSHVITTGANGADSVFAIDMDGDGDIDVLSASHEDDRVVLYKNDGNENFTPQTITAAANYPWSVYVADMDADGDMDILSASQHGDKITWYENDGSENFADHTISTTADAAFRVYAADVDSDGDMDVLSASAYDNKIAWYENNGSQAFTSHVISTTATFATSVVATDMDGDGDMDVLSASSNDNTIAWYENDGSQNFTEKIVSSTTVGPRDAYAIDLDGDGDMDVVSAAHGSDQVAWHENDGNANFSTHRVDS
ncbi:MAG: FG-GAP-like repeat-containing protein, partial [Planctomycetaceae bacterium]